MQIIRTTRSMPFLIDKLKNKAPGAETLAICLVLTCSLQIMENLLPKIPIFPWLRIGLAYWVFLPFLIRFGVFPTLILFLLRNLITLLYGGQIFSSFLISSSSGIFSFVLAGSLLRFLYTREKIGLVGLSILLACTFNVVQLGIVNIMLVQHADFYFQLSPILIWSLVSGCLTAFLVFKSRETLDLLLSLKLNLKNGGLLLQDKPSGVRSYFLLFLAVSIFISLFLFEQFTFQVVLIPILLLVNRFKNLKILLFAWPFYFYIAILHLFRSEGVYILGEWITREGLDAFLFYTARTTNVILCGQWIARFLPSLVNTFTENRYLKGFLLAMPILPALFGISISLGNELFDKLKKRRFSDLLDPIIEKLLGELRKLENPGPNKLN